MQIKSFDLSLLLMTKFRGTIDGHIKNIFESMLENIKTF